MRSLLFLWWWCGVGVLCYVCIMLLWSLYQNCSRFASTFFAFFFNLYTLPLLYKNRRDFGLFLFAFYTKDELYFLIASVQSIIPSLSLSLFVSAGGLCLRSHLGSYHFQYPLAKIYIHILVSDGFLHQPLLCIDYHENRLPHQWYAIYGACR